MDACATNWQQLINQSSLIRSEAWILACYVSRRSYAHLRAHDDLLIDPQLAQRFLYLSEQRSRGVPIAYLINEREFYGHTFFVDSRVLIPRHETELLIEIVLRLLTQRSKTNPTPAWLLDLGTGSGIIPLTLALEAPIQLSCIGVDISTSALAVAQLNQERLQNKRILNCQWLESNWFEALAELQNLADLKTLGTLNTSKTSNINPLFDVITSNPPYIHPMDQHLQQGDLRFEPRNALSDEADGLSAYRTIINQSHRYLKPNGYLVFEHGYDQAQIIEHLFKLYPHWQNIQTERDLSNLDRCTYAQYSPQ